MNESTDRDKALSYLVEKLKEPISYTIQHDHDSPFVWILLRQRMIDAMQKVDDKFNSVLCYEYDPYPQQVEQGMAMQFTLQEDMDAGVVRLSELQPFPWGNEEPEEIEWPIRKVGLTDVRPHARRHTGARKVRGR